MNEGLAKRLNEVLPLVTSEKFLSSEGIGNEIACYIFDYPATEELQVRAHLSAMCQHLKQARPDLDILHLNLLDVILKYLESRGLLKKALDMHKAAGDAAVLRALSGPLKADRVFEYVCSKHTLAKHDLILLSGVGEAWPMLRVHGLLTRLHTAMDSTPLVMFYPGTFDGTTLRLFGRIATDTSRPGKEPYYRAFSLSPEEPDA